MGRREGGREGGSVCVCVLLVNPRSHMYSLVVLNRYNIFIFTRLACHSYRCVKYTAYIRTYTHTAGCAKRMSKPKRIFNALGQLNLGSPKSGQALCLEVLPHSTLAYQEVVGWLAHRQVLGSAVISEPSER
jgi:hypothetical protein